MEEDTCAPPASDGKRAAWRSCVGRRSPRACRRALAPLTVANSPKWARGNAAPDTPTRCAARARGESEGGRGTLAAAADVVHHQHTSHHQRRLEYIEGRGGGGVCVAAVFKEEAQPLARRPHAHLFRLCREVRDAPLQLAGAAVEGVATQLWLNADHPAWRPFLGAEYRSTAAEKSNVCPAKEPTSTLVAAMSDTLHAAVATAPASWKWSCRLKAGVGASDAARMPCNTRLRRSGAPHSAAVEPLSLQDA
eukprot:CAMPEP_0196678520 /NCGR_PEP_ID=MMETSP1090-20130531/6397_1 /TAXON_ID=37098 /ORGANISM="Isochrysis sp, Strain CCMP1244" /LENGTH=249 /DNA_ID=CAMNT_0042016675 /DNA_START=284 /DNA_END=1032 /DNA_ORIENTATION=+